ncbi:MAG: apolipoprotein N-acyltransferase [Desulfobacterales bacterium]
MDFRMPQAETLRQVFWSTAAGAALTCAAPGHGLSWCGWFALALLLVAIRTATVPRALMLGLLAGGVHFLTLLYWLVPTLHRYGQMPSALAAGALLLLSFYLALYVAAFSGLIAACARKRLRHPLWCLAMVPVFWIGLEYLRTRLFSGFPWGLLGYGQYENLHIIQIADLWGIYGVSGLLALVSAGVLVAVLALGRRFWQNRVPDKSSAAVAALVVAAALAATWSYGDWRVRQTDRMVADAETMRVGIIQGNVEQSLKWDEAFRERTTRIYIRLSRELLADEKKPDLVVWPETALPFYFFYDKELTRQVLDAVARSRTHFLVGSPAYESEKGAENLSIFNSAYLIDPAGQVAGRYDKVHLVPFGEYVPLRTWLPFLGKMVPQAMDFSAGQTGQVLDMNGARLGVQICYEAIFPSLCTAMVRQGGDLIINITNDAWFGKTAAPRQHFAMAVVRTVENRRTLVRAANTGISGYVDPAGRVLETSGIFETAALVRPVPVIQDRMTFYSRRGDVLPWIAMAAGLAMVLVSLANGLKKRPRT